ncbi:MAG TPA: delta-60 repeat domain-containing protein [Pseudomonadales bacterium]|nr:delta-60 repeat domain-containing protein [Pseudomonadales bacterium]
MSAIQRDGKILVGGAFTSVNGVSRSRIARLNPDGGLDSSFDPGAGANDNVRAIAVMNDGRILVGGDFTQFDGVSRQRYVRLNSDGSRDQTASSGDVFNGAVNAIVIQPDGKTIIAGDFTTFRGVSSSRKRIVRLSVSGTVDGSFTTGLGADAAIRAVTLQPDGKVLVGGDFTHFHNTAKSRFVRLNANGTVDAGFNSIGTGADGSVRSILLCAAGGIYIGGQFTAYNGTSSQYLAHINADGSLDTASGPASPVNGAVLAMVEQADGKLVVGGSFMSVNFKSRYFAARFNVDGTLDAGFYPVMDNFVYAMSLLANGELLIGGAFAQVSGYTYNHIAILQGGDTDGDGFADSVDAFPTNAAAAADYDHDGIPDAWLQPNPYGCLPSDTTCNGLTITQDPPNVVYPLNGVYKGSSVREFSGWR